MKIAKEFKWEMGHRLPFHEGKCRNLHGHSYKLRLELEGEMDKNGMVIDYYDVNELIRPLIEQLDHSYLVCETDTELIEVLDKLNSQKVVVPFQTTAENITNYFLENISKQLEPQKIKKIKVRVYETENTYAEEELLLS